MNLKRNHDTPGESPGYCHICYINTIINELQRFIPAAGHPLGALAEAAWRKFSQRISWQLSFSSCFFTFLLGKFAMPSCLSDEDGWTELETEFFLYGRETDSQKRKPRASRDCVCCERQHRDRLAGLEWEQPCRSCDTPACNGCRSQA